MPAQVAIIHGWSDSSASFADLRNFLEANGYSATEVWLADYVSMEDDVRIEDAAKRMHQVIGDLITRNQLTVPFDLIVHSTGGLLAREWIVSNYPTGDGCPVRHLVMLAPANFGSRLASLGKSMIGRVLKGWNSWFQTGTEMLRGLELASPYQWDLARRDLLDASGGGTGPYGAAAGKVMPFVIVGSRGYPDGMRQVVNENGSDGTVRPAAANLNVVGLTVDFTANSQKPEVRPWAWRAGDIQFPLAVLPDRNHSTIAHPAGDTGSVPDTAAVLGRLIMQALDCQDADEYGKIFGSWSDISEATAALVDDAKRHALFVADEPSAAALHQFFQVVTQVRDDGGRPINDYFLEFYAPGTEGEADTVYFQRSVLADTHVNGDTSSMRCLFIDRNNLLSGYYGSIPDEAKRSLAVSLSAARVGPRVRYFDATEEGAKGELLIHEADIDRRAGLGPTRLHRNSTHLVEIIIPRQPIDNVFTLSQ